MASQSKHCYYCGWRIVLRDRFWRDPDNSLVCISHSSVAIDIKFHVPEAVAKATARRLQSTDQPVTTEG